MLNTITYSLEDVETTYHPDRPMRPVICDDCRDALDYTPGRRVNWSSFHALKRSTHSYFVLDYWQAGTYPCACCQSRRWSGRWLVERQPKH